MARLAFYTFGILHEPAGHPRTQGFSDRAPGVFEAAETSAGFIDRSRWDPVSQQPTWHPDAHPAFYVEGEHAGAPATLSLWEDLDSVFIFSYSGLHGEAMNRRKEWFVPPEWPTYAAWWVADDHEPSFVEAVERHQHLHDKGPTPWVFNFKCPFDATGQPITIDRDKLRARLAKERQKRGEQQ